MPRLVSVYCRIYSILLISKGIYSTGSYRYNALNNKDVAITNLNKVAKRAYGKDNYYPLTLTKVQVDEAILNERLVEFAAEGKSYIDIVRFGKAFDLITSLKGRSGEKQGNILLFPVNQDVINRNTKVVQTPGY